MRTKTDIVLQWYRDVWINGGWDKIEQLYHPAPGDECLIPDGTVPISELRELIIVLNNLVSDQRVRVIHTVESGDWVSALVEMHGRKAGTNQPVYIKWVAMIRVQDDRIVESYPSVNFLSFFEQLGQLPPDSFEILLSGTNFN